MKEICSEKSSTACFEKNASNEEGSNFKTESLESFKFSIVENSTIFYLMIHVTNM